MPQCAQRADEIDAFVTLLQREGVTRYLEIGLRHGSTFHYVGSALPVGSLLVGVDMPDGPWGARDGSGPSHIRRAVAALVERDRVARVIWGNSRRRTTIEAVAALGPYDCAFIDADHSYDAVRDDWLAYGEMAEIVAFHDIDAPASPTIDARKLARYGVHRLWAEIKDAHRHVEIIGAERGMGIGVLWRGR